MVCGHEASTNRRKMDSTSTYHVGRSASSCDVAWSAGHRVANPFPGQWCETGALRFGGCRFDAAANHRGCGRALASDVPVLARTARWSRTQQSEPNRSTGFDRRIFVTGINLERTSVRLVLVNRTGVPASVCLHAKADQNYEVQTHQQTPLALSTRVCQRRRGTTLRLALHRVECQTARTTGTKHQIHGTKSAHS